MARKKPKGTTSSVLFDVYYEDGSRNSNSKVPSELLSGLDGDDPALAFFEEQQAKIVEMSGRARPKIKSIVRSGKSKNPDTRPDTRSASKKGGKDTEEKRP